MRTVSRKNNRQFASLISTWHAESQQDQNPHACLVWVVLKTPFPRVLYHPTLESTKLGRKVYLWGPYYGTWCSCIMCFSADTAMLSTTPVSWQLSAALSTKVRGREREYRLDLLPLQRRERERRGEEWEREVRFFLWVTGVEWDRLEFEPS